ncbi:hypothetical protein WICPIJ_001257 [Wickerhamomyces pijperi]|uniref:Translation initiation factor eIF2B subunit alpha n=1 Tax=Wickerhamomyces pijperi TaxID=599730 RepID=A0A9P8QE23_WICPI|nr:hypothetical protein WICPIJ_001257 [Wickerhamomyces pijperi]
MSANSDFDITATYLQYLHDDPEMTMPIAAIETLVSLLKIKQPATSTELITILHSAIETLKASIPNAISLSAGCDLFMRFVLRNTHLYQDYEACRRHLVENGQLFLQRSKECRTKIAEIGFKFITDDDIVLVHSFSRTVSTLLSYAKAKKIRFRVIVTEARPTFQGESMAKLLRDQGIPVSLIVDSAVGYVINKVDKVLVGAEGVAESGGIINHVGSYQIGVLAKNANKPLYVVSESHKFVRLFPLAPDDIPTNDDVMEFSTEQDRVTKSPLVDFTPHEFITALITDLGVLTPSAVSEELIKMCQQGLNELRVQFTVSEPRTTGDFNRRHQMVKHVDLPRWELDTLDNFNESLGLQALQRAQHDTLMQVGLGLKSLSPDPFSARSFNVRVKNSFILSHVTSFDGFTDIDSLELQLGALLHQLDQVLVDQGLN